MRLTFHPHRRWLALLAALLSTLVIAPALARAQTLALVELRFVGVPPPITEQVHERLRRALNDVGYRVVAEEATSRKAKELGTPPGCFVGPCVTRLTRALKADRALVGGIAALGSSHELTLTLVEGGSGAVLAQVNDRCDVCNFKDLEDLVARAAEKLHRQALVFLSTRSTLGVTSEPRAELLVNNLAAGRTPLTLILPPGRHTLEITARGLPSLKHDVALIAGKTRTVHLNLRDAALTAQHYGERRRGRAAPPWLKWAALGTGAVMGGVGGGLWALDGRVTSDVRYVHDTRTAGVALIGVGAAAAASAIVFYLLEHDRLARRETARAQR